MSADSEDGVNHDDRHGRIRVLVSIVGLVLLAYGLFFLVLTNQLQYYVMTVLGGILLGLGGYLSRGAQAVHDAGYPSQPGGYAGD